MDRKEILNFEIKEKLFLAVRFRAWDAGPGAAEEPQG